MAYLFGMRMIQMLKIKNKYIIPELFRAEAKRSPESFMSEQAKLYIIKHKDPEIKVSYLLSVPNHKKLRSLRDYTYTRKKLKPIKNDIDNYKILFYKDICYGSTYELKTIKEHYINEIGGLFLN